MLTFILDEYFDLGGGCQICPPN